MELDTMDELSLKAAGERLEVNRPECDTRKIVAVETGLQSVRVNPLGGEDLERERVAYADVQIPLELAGDAGGRIVHGGLRVRNVRGREHPREVRVLIEHIPVPSFHRDDGKSAFQRSLVPFLATVEAFLVQEDGKFADRETVDVGNFELADKRMEARLDETSLHLVASQRVRPVENHHLDVVLGAGAHHQAKSADESVGAAADVLDVIDHDVQPLKHLLAWLAVGAIDRIDRNSRLRILEILNVGTGVGIAADSMLGGEKRLKVHSRSLVKDVDGRAEIAVNSARIGHKTDILSHKSLKATAFKDFNPGAYNLFFRSRANGGRQCRGREQNREYSFERFHIFIDCHFFPYSGSILRSARKVTATVAAQQAITIQKKPL